jgi:hypothetical protein
MKTTNAFLSKTPQLRQSAVASQKISQRDPALSKARGTRIFLTKTTTSIPLKFSSRI